MPTICRSRTNQLATAAAGAILDQLKKNEAEKQKKKKKTSKVENKTNPISTSSTSSTPLFQAPRTINPLEQDQDELEEIFQSDEEDDAAAAGDDLDDLHGQFDD